MHEAGPFKVILSELAQSSPDTLGNPYADQSAVELARLFNLDDQMAQSIISAVPIIVLDGLSARVAGIVRDRLADLSRAGCRVIITDDPSDTIPRVNWPELPAIAHVSEQEAAPASSAPVRSNGAGGFECPCCGAAFQIVPQQQGRSVASTPPPPPPAERAPASEPLASRTPATSPAQVAPPPAEDDWMNPLGTTPSEPRGGRLDDNSLLAYRRAESAPAEPPAHRSAPPPPPPDQGLQVDFTESSQEDLGMNAAVAASASASADPFEQPVADPFDPGAPDPFSEQAPDPFSDEDPFSERGAPAPAQKDGLGGSSFEASGSLHDSGSDILELDAPPRAASGSFENDLFEAEPARSGGRKPSLESLDDLDLLEESAERPPSRPQGRRRFQETDDSLSILEDSQEDGRGAPDLDEVLSMFGPEDQQPLDDMSGLEPQPLDLSPSRGRASSRGSGDPFDDELSDILEPLNPTEAMEIIKSQKGRPAGRRGSSLGPLDDEESLDIFADSAPPKRSKRKKTRGVPFSASDEDLALFEESRGPSRSKSKQRSSSKAGRKKTDPFARARRAIESEDPPSRKATRNGRSSRSRRSRGGGNSGGGGGGGGGGAPKGNGDHGLVLSRISDPDKKEKAAELIAEIKGCSIDSAHRLTDRTIIPVLKGVSRDVAEFHLDKFKRYKIAGRVTTRQRS